MGDYGGVGGYQHDPKKRKSQRMRAAAAKRNRDRRLNRPHRDSRDRDEPDYKAWHQERWGFR